MSPFTWPSRGAAGPGPGVDRHMVVPRAGRQPWDPRERKWTMFGLKKKDQDELSLRQLWDRERERAMTPAERSEIDAIFSRYA